MLLCNHSVIFATDFTKKASIFGSDTTICQGDSLILNAHSGYVSYLWQDGSTDSIFIVKNQGLYWVRLISSIPDTTYDSIYVYVINKPNINLGPDTVLCQGQSYTFHAGSGYLSYHWQNGSSDSVYVATTVGIYSVTVSNQCGSDVDSASITNVYPNPQPDIGNDTTVCPPINIILNGGTGYSSYIWQDASTNQYYNVVAPGNYSVTVTDNHNCSGSDDIVISQKPTPTPDLGPPQDLCNKKNVTLDAGSGFNSYKWQDGSTSQTYTATSAGIYSVTTTSDCGTASASVAVSNCEDCICDIPNAFTPNTDGENDILYVLGSGFSDLEFIIYDRLGVQLFISHSQSYGWDGKYLGAPQKNEVYIYVIRAKCNNGDKIFKKGNVTLLR